MLSLSGGSAPAAAAGGLRVCPCRGCGSELTGGCSEYSPQTERLWQGRGGGSPKRSYESDRCCWLLDSLSIERERLIRRGFAWELGRGSIASLR